MKRPSDYLEFLYAAMAPQARWRPAADVYRCDRGWLVKLDLAGVRPEDIEVRVSGARLSICGTRRDWRVYERQEAQSMEIAYSQFERVFELPQEIVRAEVHTEYRDGMLLVHLLVEPEVEP